MEASNVFQSHVLGGGGPDGGNRGPACTGARGGVSFRGRPYSYRSHRPVLEREQGKFRGPLRRRRPGCVAAADGPLTFSARTGSETEQYDRRDSQRSGAGRLAATV